MGLLDFLFGKKEDQKQTRSIEEKEASNEPQKIKYETRWLAQDITKDRTVIEAIAQKMIEEDPFKTEYEGKESIMDFKRVGDKVNKYNEVTTVNIDVRSDNGSHKLIIEGIELGEIPEDKFQEVQPYYKKDDLTAYAYVTGGPYKQYNKEKDQVEESNVPYGLDIYLQFT